MKKILYAYAIFSGLLFFGSCSDFLEEKPPLYVNEGDIYSSPKRIESTLLGLYGTIKNFNTNTRSLSLLGGKGYLVFDNRGDDVINISNNLSSLFDTYNMRILSVSGENEDYWTASYLAINRVNTFLQSIEGAKEVLGDEKYSQFRSEALFVRAVSYYYLNNLYATPYILNKDAKSVPLRLQAESTNANNNLAASTVKEVYDQVLADLDNANIAVLPDGVNTYDGATRATKAAAHMLRMRVYMSTGEWNKAIEEGKAVSGYSLVTNVTSLYKTPFYSTESIFSLPMATTNVPNTQQSLAEYYTDGKILLVDNENGIMSKPNYSLANDARVKNFFSPSDRKLLKYVDVTNKLEWVPIFRYAETLLGLAESYANLGGAANETLAKGYLKQVRSRSIPTGDPLVIDALSGEQLKEAISNERRLELIGEGIRGVDILRKGESLKRGTFVLKPTDNGYTWPIPQSELASNKEI
ncbi:RagB/SusD family nutrient uptake outer membrane protein [Dysgonomonas sp. HGC4]|uniref:RagB/SusD family nutrient uptake outer membrane protein n=1 Tax=Dysgonomonas sp. HGC4 TaxID=1658009 RepID=UPI000680C2C7|nr:RagB/SusD family nutrient uptake outer membrane protein [Dysgonomonas sp. HGC4]MBD8349689.1 RagB/SusD family nutrient uptake outer membrane protein [Dysgonomonas sp. HGC4]